MADDGKQQAQQSRLLLIIAGVSWLNGKQYGGAYKTYFSFPKPFKGVGFYWQKHGMYAQFHLQWVEIFSSLFRLVINRDNYTCTFPFLDNCSMGSRSGKKEICRFDQEVNTGGHASVPCC